MPDYPLPEEAFEWTPVPSPSKAEIMKKLDAFDLFIMSVWKPDPELRTDAMEQGCYDELMQIREEMLEYLNGKRKEITD